MQSIYESIKDRLTIAIRNRDQPRKDIFRFLKGRLDQTVGPTDEVATKLIRSLLNEAKENPTAFSAVEVAEMSDLVPSLLTEEKTLEGLVAVLDDMAAAKNDGQAMGIAMKALKGLPVDSEIVKQIVARTRSV